MDKFSAAPQTLGYLFQIRYALYLILDAPSDFDLKIEGLDDITFEQEGNAKDLFQTKHHTKEANLSDFSVDLWKTLRIWSIRYKKNEIDPQKTKLTLITTANCSKDSAVSFLRESDIKTRSPGAALGLLDKVAVGSENTANKSAYEAYLALSSSERKVLLSSIYILSSSVNILNLDSLIKEKLQYAVRPEFQDDFFERLEGWWLGRAIHALSKDQIISKKEVEAQIYDLCEEYRQDSLPIHEFIEALPDIETIKDTDRSFIEQLRLIKLGTSRLTKAISDYYRAFYQRSKWLREGHVQVGELTSYEAKLVDEWERIFEAICEEIDQPITDELLIKAGKQIYNRIDQELQIHIRPRATESFIMRGTYHLLANTGAVGWHPEFKERLKHLFEIAMEGTLEKKHQPNI